MVIECPHCYKKVIPMQDGRCPGCGKNTKDTSNVNLNMTLLEIPQSSPLPQICCLCGENAEGTVLIERSNAKGGESLFIRILVFVFSPMLYLFGNGFQRTTTKLKIYLPSCSKCSCGTFEPRHVDFENYSMTFAVHKKFKEFYSNLNSPV
jgi:hypothetical protein